MILTPADAPRQISSQSKIRIYVVDDHPLMRLGLRRAIECEPDLVFSGEANSAREALDRLRTVAADLVLVDIALPGTNGIELIKNIRAEHNALPILVLSAHDEEKFALRALRAGADGYLMKKEAADQLLPAIRKAANGEIAVSKTFAEQLIYKVAKGAGDKSPVDALSDRELEVLTLIGAGRSTQEIALSLSLSGKTVESHRLHIKEKLGLRTAAEMVRFALDWTAHQSGIV